MNLGMVVMAGGTEAEEGEKRVAQFIQSTVPTLCPRPVTKSDNYFKQHCILWQNKY
jgi:hypothetical protein